MRRRIRRLVLALAAVIAALSINAMSLQAGGGQGGGEESCGFCIDFTECAGVGSDQDVIDMCISQCGEAGAECFQSSPMCGLEGPDTWIECGPDEGGGFEN